MKRRPSQLVQQPVISLFKTLLRSISLYTVGKKSLHRKILFILAYSENNVFHGTEKFCRDRAPIRGVSVVDVHSSRPPRSECAPRGGRKPARHTQPALGGVSCPSFSRTKAPHLWSFSHKAVAAVTPFRAWNDA